MLTAKIESSFEFEEMPGFTLKHDLFDGGNWFIDISVVRFAVVVQCFSYFL